MQRRHCVLTALVTIAATVALVADSPLTSTDLASAYDELPAVNEALLAKRMTPAVMRFLAGAAPNDQKAAVVNALGWQSPGNALAFLQGLAFARGVAPDDIKLAQMRAPDRFVFGYLLALETYAAPSALRPGALDVWGATPMQLLDQAATALPGDFAVHYVRGLVEAQHAMQTSNCSVYLATARVLEKFPVERRNLRQRAIGSVEAYMALYKPACETAPARPAGRLNPEHDQIYALVRLGETIVAGTQAGVVVWHPDQPRPVASRDEEICGALQVWRNAVWAGCQGRVVRWDGTGWKSYLHDAGASDESFAPIAGVAGELLVHRLREVWRYDAARDTFVAATLALGEIPRSAVVRRNGDLWHVDFLTAIVGPTRKYAVKSEAYPGRDPRTIVEDATGRLWVTDFDSGGFVLNETTGAFERDSTLDSEAADVAVDPARKRIWWLHYSDGPVLKESGRIRDTVNLEHLEYMHDLLLDEQNGDLWVAGWAGLVRLREENGRWKPQTWRVPR